MSESTVLVPLDGSNVSEAVIPYAGRLARAIDANLTLVVVWEEPEETLLPIHADLASTIALSGQEACRQYAQEHASRLQASGITAGVHVLQGKPAAEILRLADEMKVRCIALASHGRGGIGRWWFGSVASGIVRHATAPVLLVGPELIQAPQAAPEFKRVLVPLDGSDIAERALDFAAEIAAKADSTLILAQVLRWSTQAFLFGVPDVDVAHIDEQLTKASGAYLAKLSARLKGPAEEHVLHGAPAFELIEFVKQRQIDLIVMGTHGRGPVMRLALGSVAERMVHAQAPVLLVR